jgi:serine/threonine protein kinase
MDVDRARPEPTQSQAPNPTPKPTPHFKPKPRLCLAAVCFLHSNGVIHRDLKGANILIDSSRRNEPSTTRDRGVGPANADPAHSTPINPDPADPAPTSSGRGDALHRPSEGAELGSAEWASIKIADFGSSRLLDAASTVGADVRTLKGTAYWMAPEVIQEQPYGRKADVWSAGCVLLEMLQGYPPWSDAKLTSNANQWAIMFHIANSNEAPTMPPDLHTDSLRILSRCFERQAANRPSAAELLEAVHASELNS